MAAATFRFYAELTDFVGSRELRYEFSGAPSVKDAIEALGVPHAEVDLILIDGVSVDFGAPLRDGARVAVYPVFEAFDVEGLSRVRPQPLRDTRFVLDGHLGRLAAYLRMLGFDALWERQPRDEDLALVSSAERRILLTRDVGLLKRNQVTHGLWVRSRLPREQLAAVVDRLHLAGTARPFTRCLKCNGMLEPVARQAVAVPPGVAERHTEFSRCPGCGRVYWPGTHRARMQRLVDEVLKPPRSPPA